VDVFGLMNGKLSKMSETSRVDAAAGLAILLREKAEVLSVATFLTSAWSCRRGVGSRCVTPS
jgi:hypothetical protein